MNVENIYIFLINLYPKDFQKSFKSDIEQNIRDLYRDSNIDTKYEKFKFISWICFDIFKGVVKENYLSLKNKMGAKEESVLTKRSKYYNYVRIFILLVFTAFIAFNISSTLNHGNQRMVRCGQYYCIDTPYYYVNQFYMGIVNSDFLIEEKEDYMINLSNEAHFKINEMTTTTYPSILDGKDVANMSLNEIIDTISPRFSGQYTITTDSNNQTIRIPESSEIFINSQEITLNKIHFTKSKFKREGTGYNYGYATKKDNKIIVIYLEPFSDDYQSEFEQNILTTLRFL